MQRAPLNASLTLPRNVPPLFPDSVAYAQAIHMGEPKEKFQHYKRRPPETAPPYQLVYHSLDELEHISHKPDDERDDAHEAESTS